MLYKNPLTFVTNVVYIKSNDNAIAKVKNTVHV